jgi:hypothetical protein
MGLTNVVITRMDNKLVVEIDLTQQHGTTNNGKATRVATTHGFTPLPSVDDDKFDFALNLNCTGHARRE